MKTMRRTIKMNLCFIETLWRVKDLNYSVIKFVKIIKS
jgi:hypothetical protein